ncbi:MAG: hypothetical protein U0587_04305 [Candidatus Binatia bacterium]
MGQGGTWGKAGRSAQSEQSASSAYATIFGAAQLFQLLATSRPLHTYRWDHIENDLSGARAVLTRRLTTVEVKTDVPSAGTPVRTYSFWYDQEGNGQAGYRSILSWVDVTGGYPRQIFVHAPGTAGLATQPTVTAPYTALRVTDESQEVSQTLLF